MIPLLSELFDRLPLGVIVLDTAGRAVVYNRVEQLLAGRRKEEVLGRDFFREHGYCMDVPGIAGLFRSRIGVGPFEADAEFSFPFPFLATPRDVHVRLTSFQVGDSPYAMLTLRDISHERAVALMRRKLEQMVLHDLNSPLTAVASQLGYLDALVGDADDTSNAIAQGLAAVRQVDSTLLNLLDAARFETNSFVLRRLRVDLRALAVQSVTSAMATARAADVSIQVADPVEPVVAWVDPEVLRRVLDNLIDNAIRHGRRVTVSARLRGPDAVVEVADDGPGLAPEIRDEIFEKYVPLTPDRPRAGPHHQGLGLAFVRLGVRAHGGEVEVEALPKRGTLFRVTLPIEPAVSGPAPSESGPT